MYELITGLLTKENITLALSIFGAIGTVCSFVYTAISTRKNINVRVSKAYFYKNTVLIHILIDNKSRLPITINRISLIIGKSVFSSFDIKTQIFKGVTRQNNEITDTRLIFSPEFPICIGSLGGTNCYPFFELPPEAFETLSTELTLQFHTNRGMIKKKKLSFQLVDSPAKMC